MLSDSAAFSGFTVDDITAAQAFYGATYTIVNFPVDDIDSAVDELTARRVPSRTRSSRR